MNTIELKGSCNVIKGKLKQEYASFTEDDFLYLEGAEDELLGRLQVNVGKSKEEILALIQKAKQMTL
jgi:uncharacterized protein YjbJ (UPF0337 family)